MWSVWKGKQQHVDGDKRSFPEPWSNHPLTIQTPWIKNNNNNNNIPNYDKSYWKAFVSKNEFFSWYYKWKSPPGIWVLRISKVRVINWSQWLMTNFCNEDFGAPMGIKSKLSHKDCRWNSRGMDKKKMGAYILCQPGQQKEPCIEGFMAHTLKPWIWSGCQV